MILPSPNPVVHLELHTGNLARACSFYARVCGWQLEKVEVGHRSYQTLDWGGGSKEASSNAGSPGRCGSPISRFFRSTRPPSAQAASGRASCWAARGPGRLAQRGPGAGGGEIAFWQCKTRADRR
jgi:catechol 2,3-dioxygenase-like lactoylglutathione lyase family enzyme